jgi:DNA-binding CsgD family transcriptional regulator
VFPKVLREYLDGALVVGFACCLAWLLTTLRAGVLLSASAEPLLLHVPFYLCLTGVAAITLVAGGILLPNPEILFKRLLPRILPAAAMILATISLPLITLLYQGLAVILAGVAGALAGCGLAFFFLQWGTVWTTFTFKAVVVSAIAAWGICAFIFFIVLFFDPFAATVSSAVLPLASLLLLRIVRRRPVKVPPFGRGASPPEPRRTTLRLAILGFTYGLVNEWTRLSFIQRIAGEVDSSYFILANGLALLFTLLVVFITILLPLLIRRDILFELPYRLVLLLGVVSTLLLVLPENPPVISYALSMTAYLCLAVTLWTTTISFCRRFPAQITRIIGLVVAAWMAGPLVGAQLNHELFIMGRLPSQELSAVLGVCLMLLVYSFVYRESDIAETTMEGRAGAFGEKCAQVSWRYNLTERESEILVHLARGRDATWIQEELCLSHSTVSTHRQHIYEKLGVHSRQDLIDMVENT